MQRLVFHIEIGYHQLDSRSAYIARDEVLCTARGARICECFKRSFIEVITLHIPAVCLEDSNN